MGVALFLNLWFLILWFLILWCHSKPQKPQKFLATKLSGYGTHVAPCPTRYIMNYIYMLLCSVYIKANLV